MTEGARSASHTHPRPSPTCSPPSPNSPLPSPLLNFSRSLMSGNISMVQLLQRRSISTSVHEVSFVARVHTPRKLTRLLWAWLHILMAQHPRHLSSNRWSVSAGMLVHARSARESIIIGKEWIFINSTMHRYTEEIRSPIGLDWISWEVKLTNRGLTFMLDLYASSHFKYAIFRSYFHTIKKFAFNSERWDEIQKRLCQKVFRKVYIVESYHNFNNVIYKMNRSFRVMKTSTEPWLHIT